MASPIPLPDSIDETADQNTSEDEAASMAALMGFSTFGTQPTSKKRKYNPKTDAMIDGQALEEIDRGGKRGKGSGGNDIPLGKMRVLGGGVSSEAHGKAEGRNPDELDIDYDDDEEEEEVGGGTSIPIHPSISIPPPHTDGAPPSSPRRAELTSIQAKIDAIITTSTYAPVEPTSSPPPPSLTPKPQSQNPRHNNNAGRNRNEPWYIGYFDPSFIQNPWEELERERGLEARGRWPEKRVRAGRS